MSGRAAVIAFDSVDAELVARLLGEGRLPTLADVLARGGCAELRDLQDMFTTPTWTSLATGCDPHQHEVFGADQLVPGSYRIAPTDAGRALRRPPFWRHASDAGVRTTVASFYGCPLLPGFLGTQVVGWGSHDGYSRDRWSSDPPGLVDELERRFGPRRLRYHSRRPSGEAELRSYVDGILEGLEQQADALCHLATSTDWQLFLGAFADCHQAGHYLWHLDHPEHPEHDPELDPALKGALADVYAKTDESIGRLLKALPADTSIFVVSPYSMCANHQLDRSLATLLERLGFSARSEGGPRGARARAIGLGRSAARLLLPQRARFALGPRLGRDRLVGELALAGVDWGRTRAFALPGDTSSNVRLNLAGREPEGSVQPGSGYDRACHELAEAFTALRDADSGEQVVTRVARFDQLYGCPPPGPMPDLCVQWREVGAVRALRLPDGDELVVERTDERASVHCTPGFVALCGPGIEASGSPALRGPTARLVDLAPSVLRLLGLEPPEGLAGSPLPQLARAERV